MSSAPDDRAQQRLREVPEVVDDRDLVGDELGEEEDEAAVRTPWLASNAAVGPGNSCGSSR